jgi:hypothetical protein
MAGKPLLLRKSSAQRLRRLRNYFYLLITDSPSGLLLALNRKIAAS